MISIEYDNRQVLEALERLLGAVDDLTPVMRDIGEYLVASTRERFQAGEAPDGTPWEPNTEATYLSYLGVFRSSFGTSGRLTKAGAGRAAGKSPGIGETRQLSTRIFYTAERDSVVVGSPLEYSGTFHYGASRGQYGSTRRGSPIPWGDIPARPFLGLSADDQADILEIIQEHYRRALEG